MKDLVHSFHSFLFFSNLDCNPKDKFCAASVDFCNALRRKEKKPQEPQNALVPFAGCNSALFTSTKPRQFALHDQNSSELQTLELYLCRLRL